MVRINLSTALLAIVLALGAGGVMYSYLHADESSRAARPAESQASAPAVAASPASVTATAPMPAALPAGQLPPIDAMAHPLLETATFAYG